MDEVFRELHAGLPKQGPGSDASTRRALALVEDLPPEPRILDLGCGPGRQTLVLARATGGHVTAVDLDEGFLDEVRAKAREAGLAERIRTVHQSFDRLAPDGPFDLVWCEGAIYLVGFAEGLRAWRRWVRPGGALVVSHIAWLTESVPERVRAFWAAAYPDLATHEENLRTIARAGCELVGSFTLSDADWIEGYYDPLEQRIARLRALRGDAVALRVLDAEQEEIDVFREREGSYGYVFYVMRVGPPSA